MKKTFNNFRTLAALLMAGAAFAACSSDDNIIENQQPATSGEQVYTLTINATNGDGTTRALDLDGTKLVASWTNGDVLTVYNQSNFEALGGTLTASNASGSTATFSGALTGTIAVGNELILNYQEHNYFTEFPNQDGTLKGTNGAEKYDLANAHVTVASVDGSGNITIEEPSASFTTWTAMLKLTLQDGSSNPLNATSLKISVDGIGELLAFSSIDADASTANGDGILYFAMPPVGEVANAKSTTTAALEAATVTFTATAGGKTYTATKTGYKFAAGKYYAATLTMTEVVPSFTINAGGTKVLFAPGNLQATYNGSSWTWGFAANQWDYIGRTAGNTYINGDGTMSAPGTVDFFGWVGASSTWGGVAQYGICITEEQNSVNTYGNVANEALKRDWGNTISDGYTWRTLTEEEWTYVISTRIGTALPCEDHARYTKATINTDNGSGGVNGLILFPDGLTLDTSEFTNFGDANGYSNYGTLCTTAEWAALSAKGCVFLPSAGSRDANTGTAGRYWTSTSYKTNPSSARYVDITTTGYVSVRTAPRCNGFSVRLAREVE